MCTLKTQERKKERKKERKNLCQTKVKPPTNSAPEVNTYITSQIFVGGGGNAGVTQGALVRHGMVVIKDEF